MIKRATAAVLLAAALAGCGSTVVNESAETSLTAAVSSAITAESTAAATVSTQAKTTVKTTVTSTETTSAAESKTQTSSAKAGGTTTSAVTTGARASSTTAAAITYAANTTATTLAETTATTTTTTTTTTSTTTTTTSTTTTTTTSVTAEPEPAPIEDTELFNNIQQVVAEGYGAGWLVPYGVEGINRDYYKTLPSSPAYTSGKIAVGDSRCCQLGIYSVKNGIEGLAAFGVWGGHYHEEPEAHILSDELLADLTACLEAAAQAGGSVELYFFATVNDYDFVENDNAENIFYTVAAAERLAELCEGYNGSVTVVGFEGCGRESDIFGTPQEVFNRYVEDYNAALRSAVEGSERLRGAKFTTVGEITGGSTGFVSDNLHYSSQTIENIIRYIINGK